MGNKLDCNGVKHHLQPLSLESVTKKLEVYAIRNNLMLYNKETREMIEKLFVLEQSHVGDKLMNLMREKKQQQKNELMKALQRIDLEEFDELRHITRMQNSNKIELIMQPHATQDDEATTVKISSKYFSHGERCLRQDKVLLIINLCGQSNCEKITAQTDLISRKSPIELFLNKIQALKTRYECKYEVIIICPRKSLEEMGRFLHNNMRILSYEPDQPCFSQQGKIILYGNKIQFNENQGDIVHFIMTHSYFRDLHKKYDYVNFCDLNNFASPAINPIHLGWLKTHEKVKILASLKQAEKNIDKVGIKKSFIENNLEYGDILMKSQVFQQMANRQNSLYQVLATRIERKKMNQRTNCFYFSRLPQDILYKPFAQVTKISFDASDKVEYSNFCKGVLGVQNENQLDIVEICPSFLHGDPAKLQQIRQTLQNKESQSGFPLIIMRVQEDQE